MQTAEELRTLADPNSANSHPGLYGRTTNIFRQNELFPATPVTKVYFDKARPTNHNRALLHVKLASYCECVSKRRRGPEGTSVASSYRYNYSDLALGRSNQFSTTERHDAVNTSANEGVIPDGRVHTKVA
ncbi:hypothetical protein J6590_012789 [Homalodisca vitripennis]|nr:hypothetical protein J6590_012789 [Homalodisca vitripennis]